MKRKIQILDCTLRDGGYCNKWKFGKNNIRKIITNIVKANIEIVECGFLTNRIVYSEDVSKFTEVDQIKQFLPRVDATRKFVVMINYGEYKLDMIPPCKESPIDGIRVAFHKKDVNEALDYCLKIKEKGYLVFIQPMVTMNYSDEEFIGLIAKTNEVLPYAFYIVDSFGTMKKRELLHYLGLVQENLNVDTVIGFHSHNNIQSAFSNALCLIENSLTYNLIIDTSVYGMGRGAGNLNSELFLNELNSDYGTAYSVKPLLQIMDEILNRFYEEQPWGYSLPNYLSAVHMIHPSYAIHLYEKNTLTIDAMDDIFSLMDKEKAVEFNESYIDKIYLEYMSRGKINKSHIKEFKQIIEGKKVLLIAPGKTAKTEENKIVDFRKKENPITISINYEYTREKIDFVFVSNMKRFKELSQDVYSKTITTTNIQPQKTYVSFDYFSLVNSLKSVSDNAGLMAIQMMINIGCREIYLAGFDGYEYIAKENYEKSAMTLAMSENQVDELNAGMHHMLEHFSKEVKIQFLTTSRFG